MHTEGLLMHRVRSSLSSYEIMPLSFRPAGVNLFR